MYLDTEERKFGLGLWFWIVDLIVLIVCFDFMLRCIIVLWVFVLWWIWTCVCGYFTVYWLVLIVILCFDCFAVIWWIVYCCLRGFGCFAWLLVSFYLLWWCLCLFVCCVIGVDSDCLFGWWLINFVMVDLRFCGGFCLLVCVFCLCWFCYLLLVVCLYWLTYLFCLVLTCVLL